MQRMLCEDEGRAVIRPLIPDYPAGCRKTAGFLLRGRLGCDGRTAAGRAADGVPGGSIDPVGVGGRAEAARAADGVPGGSIDPVGVGGRAEAARAARSVAEGQHE